MVPYLSPKDEVSLGSLTHDQGGAFEPQWLTAGKGLLAANGFDATIKLRPNTQDLEELKPVFTQRWEQFFADTPDEAPVFVGLWAVSVYRLSVVHHSWICTGVLETSTRGPTSSR
ncbi:hypothetical protein B0H17DRAFT_1092198 [Mycena rosella]|uniref:Uncharacterized protein n=1 Tax=Mycena rosella TaxID=1033263 RepID=A0AAD7CVF7_MYCRO|nr:hypothetical protein B0H17DRAFT_1092198 [Mycena rosella]